MLAMKLTPDSCEAGAWEKESLGQPPHLFAVACSGWLKLMNSSAVDLFRNTDMVSAHIGRCTCGRTPSRTAAVFVFSIAPLSFPPAIL